MGTPDTHYAEKLARYEPQTSLPQLAAEERQGLHELALRYRFTFQELKLVSVAAVDLNAWCEEPLLPWWRKQESDLELRGRELKKELFRRLEARLGELRRRPSHYPDQGLSQPRDHKLKLVAEEREGKNVFGMCPVASEETVCCNLRTLDAVESCGFGCSYCTIQTFYGDRVVFDSQLREKLRKIELDEDRFYHVGTGQSSDSLIWGNREGLLDALFEFARSRPNVLLELKTKSKNVAHLLQSDVPRNVVVSWSLSTPTLIANEEHFTASLEERLTAARQLADSGGKVAFHFHPILHYDAWAKDYRDVVEAVLGRFDPSEVLFLSFGSLTFIKPVVKAIRRRAWESKILQAELVPTAKGKLSYPEELKKELFSHLYALFEPWHGKVFMYLCMEEARYWTSTFGRVYASNEEFEEDFGRAVRAKL